MSKKGTTREYPGVLPWCSLEKLVKWCEFPYDLAVTMQGMHYVDIGVDDEGCYLGVP